MSHKPQLRFTPATLPDAIVGQAYPAASVGTASGGTAPYAVSAISGLPAGMALSGSGLLSGTPTTSGSLVISLRISDSSHPPQSINSPVSLVVDAAWPPPFDDSALAPADVATLCKLPQGTVYNVKDHGAKGDGVADDTAALRSVFALANQPNTTVVGYLPAGTYNVCPQTGDPNTWGPLLFDLSQIPPTSLLVVIGDGPTKTFLKGFMPGLQDPVTHWNVLATTGEPQISRFCGFQAIGNNPSGGFQIRSMTFDGQAGFTGDFTSGGNATTGDGWDWFHKCVRIDRSSVGPVLIFNSVLKNWRGEIVYSGGTAAQGISIVISQIDSSNGSSVSCSTAMLMENSAVGPNVNNGFENYCITAGQNLVVKGSTVSGARNNGLVFIGVAGSSCLIDNCDLDNNHNGVLLSEAGHGITIQNSRLVGNANAIITSILGQYPGLPLGFDNLTISGNTFTNSGVCIDLQNPVAGLTVSNNSVAQRGALIDGEFNPGDFPAGSLTISNNTIGSGCTDIGGNYGSSFTAKAVGLWSGTQHPAGEPSPFRTIGYRFDDFSTDATGPFRPKTDWTLLNSNGCAPANYRLFVDPNMMTDYPVGFTTSFRIGAPNFALKADPTWNTFAADVVVTDGLKIRLNASRLFEVV